MMHPLSWPGLPEHRRAGCKCPTVDASGWNHYGTWPPPMEVDAWCPIHGLKAILEDA
jgi:hypothetical protein